MLYIILIIAIIFAIISVFVKERTGNFLYVMMALLLIIYCGLRDPFIYPDNANYYDIFNGYWDRISMGSINIGYLWLNRIINNIYPSFQFLCFIISVFVVTSYAKFIKDNSPYIWISLVLYILVNYYPSFFLLRQYLAMSVFMFSIRYVVSREAMKFYACAIIAISFHTTAIIILPLYYLYDIRYTEGNMLALFIGGLLATNFFILAGNIISSYSSYYAHYFDVEGQSAWNRAIMKIYIAFVYLIILGKASYRKGINRIVFYCMMINVVICVGAVNIYGVFRLREYYALSDFIGIPIIIEHLNKNGGQKKLVGYAMVLIYVILLYISFDNFVTGRNMNNMYRPFWEGLAL